MKKQRFLDTKGNQIPTCRIVQFLLSVQGFIRSGVRKQAAIISSIDQLCGYAALVHPRTARNIWNNKRQWLKVNG